NLRLTMNVAIDQCLIALEHAGLVGQDELPLREDRTADARDRSWLRMDRRRVGAGHVTREDAIANRSGGKREAATCIVDRSTRCRGISATKWERMNARDGSGGRAVVHERDRPVDDNAPV